MAVLGIFITGGADSAAWFDDIANATKDIADSDDQSTETVLATVNLNQIVQRINPTFSGDFNYWYYNGSLTTPGCEEVVHWVVAEKALQVTDDQVTYKPNCAISTLNYRYPFFFISLLNFTD